MGILILLTFIISAFSAEVDNLTGRAKMLSMPDSLEILDKHMNEVLDKIFVGSSCSPRREIQGMPEHYKSVVSTLGCDPTTYLEQWILDSPSMGGFCQREGCGIYADIPATVNLCHWKGVSTITLKVAGSLVGIDKLGHLISQGYDYFRVAYVERKGLIAALKYGIRLENNLYGLGLTEVFSYGDLAANYSGLQFWADLLYGRNPYYYCVEGEYKKRRSFSWAYYINDSWDEGYNCSRYTEELQEYVDRNMQNQSPALTCPVQAAKCNQLSRLPCARGYINPKCLEYANQHSLEPIKINYYCDDDIITNEHHLKDRPRARTSLGPVPPREIPTITNESIAAAKDQNTQNNRVRLNPLLPFERYDFYHNVISIPGKRARHQSRRRRRPRDYWDTVQR